MRAKKPASAGMAFGAILMLVVVAGMFLSAYTYPGPGIGKTWPAIFIGVGVWFVLGGLLEAGLGIMGLFGLWLASNVTNLSFSKLWPFLILLVAVLVAVGFIRARSSSEQKS
ncbi:MAG: hypothetical protein RBU30_01590 [Polyangia bacterium]|jgi:hypothetical protein|nr:hypothetical protein [Polyangia bacterium]